MMAEEILLYSILAGAVLAAASYLLNLITVPHPCHDFKPTDESIECRRFSLLEQWYWHARPFQRRFTVTVHVETQPNGKVPGVEDIAKAAKVLSRDHPCLRRCLRADSLSFDSCRDDPSIQVFPLSDWKNEISEAERGEHRFDEKSLQWRILYFHEANSGGKGKNRFALSLQFHHIIMDGVSGMRCLMKLVETLSSILREDSERDTTEVDFPPVDSGLNIEAIVPCRPSVLATVSTALRVLVWEKIFPPVTGYIPYIPSEVKGMQHRDMGESFSQSDFEYVCISLSPSFSLDEDKIFSSEMGNPAMRLLSLPTLVEKSRLKSVSINGVLMAAIYFAMAAYRRKEWELSTDSERRGKIQDIERSERLSTQFPVNLQRLGDIPESNFGLHVSSCSHDTLIRGDFQFWDVAREITDYCKSHVRAKAAKMLGMIALCPDIGKMLRDDVQKVPGGFTKTLTVSNLGRIACPALDPAWKLPVAVFTQQGYIGSRSAVTINITTLDCADTKQQVLCITLASARPAVKKDLAPFLISAIAVALQWSVKTSGSTNAGMKLFDDYVQVLKN